MASCETLDRRFAAVCGRYCATCDAQEEGICRGCAYQLGTTRRGECPIFACCAVTRGLEHCGLCPDFPCQVFVKHAPPLDIAKLYRALHRRAEIGTAAWLAEQAEAEAKEPA
jgi:hypothetical protein